MNEIEKAKFEDKCEREIDKIYFKEVYNQLKKAQKLKVKHFQLVEKQELISKLQDTVKNATSLLYNLENNLNEYKPRETEIYQPKKVFFKNHCLNYNTKMYERTYTTLNNIHNLTLHRFRRVFDTKFLMRELQTTIQHLTCLLLKLESNIEEIK
jgi:type IV secretory pathway VirB4 component